MGLPERRSRSRGCPSRHMSRHYSLYGSEAPLTSSCRQRVLCGYVQPLQVPKLPLKDMCEKSGSAHKAVSIPAEITAGNKRVAQKFSVMCMKLRRSPAAGFGSWALPVIVALAFSSAASCSSDTWPLSPASFAEKPWEERSRCVVLKSVAR